MEYSWSPPIAPFVKLNVHFISVPNSLPNGNLNSAGIIMRDTFGNKLWDAMGPLHGMREVEAILWCIQAGMVESVTRGWD